MAWLSDVIRSVDQVLATELLDRIPIGIFVWHLHEPAVDESLRLVYANPASSRMLGIDAPEHYGQRLVDVFPWVDPGRVKTYAAICRDGKAREIEPIRIVEPPAREGLYAMHLVPVPDQSVAVCFENISEARVAMTEAQRLSSNFESILEHVPAMVFVKEAQHLSFVRFNRAGEELLGIPREGLIGKSDHDFFPPEQAEFFISKDREVLASRTVLDIPEEPIDTPVGRRWLHTRKIPLLSEAGTPAYLVGISMDITERREAQLRTEKALAETEEQLRHSQKLEAIGRLAGGVAHDFNNLLSLVLSHSEMALLELSHADPLRTDLEQIRDAGLRAAELTRQLLAFSRQQVLQPRVIDLNVTLRGLERMLRRLLGEDIELALSTAADLRPVKADPTQVEQVVMNLVVNARDAMPTGGKLTIETANVELDEEYAAQHVGAVTGPYAMIAVSDNGTGMDRETLAKIFEPFFTTKEKGRGTGLGLSTVFGIVKQSGGTIWVYSEPGRGTTFKVYLPLTDEKPAERAPSAPAQARGRETVLLVEDDDRVRAVAVEILRRSGYRVFESRSPADAIELAEGLGGRLDLLVADVVMPEMGGRQLAEKVRALVPSARVLFMSGYTDDAVVRHGVLESDMEFLQKPITPESLARKVRDVLDR